MTTEARIRADRSEIEQILRAGSFPYYTMYNGVETLYSNSSPNAETNALMSSAGYMAVFNPLPTDSEMFEELVHDKKSMAFIIIGIVVLFFLMRR